MGNNKIILLLVMLAGLILAVVAGSFVAGGNYIRLALGTASLLAVIYSLFLNQGWIYFAFLWACTCFVIRPLGFAMSSMEIACALMAVFVFMNSWRKTAYQRTPISQSFSTYFACLALLAIYCLVHFIYNVSDPLHGESIVWTNAAKQYLTMIGGFLLIAVATTMPTSNWQLKNPAIPLGIFLLLGTLTNIGIRGYAVYGLGAGQVDVATGQEVEITSLYIPIIHLTDNIYALRVLSPLCTLLGVAILTSHAAYGRNVSSRALGLFLIIAGLAGAILSGGRGTLFIALIMPISVLFLRRRFVPLVAASVAAMLLIVGARAVYEYDDRLVAPGIQRALAMIPGLDMERAKASIDSSSNWRLELFNLALKDWQQSPRTVLSGRCVYEFTDRDAARLGLEDPYTYRMFSALRRGATHNLITDLLVPVGLVGLLLYFLTYFALLKAIHSTKHLLKPESPLHDIRLVGLLALSASLVYGLIGGTFVQPTDALLVATLACASQSAGHRRLANKGSENSAIENSTQKQT